MSNTFKDMPEQFQSEDRRTKNAYHKPYKCREQLYDTKLKRWRTRERDALSILGGFMRRLSNLDEQFETHYDLVASK